MSTVRRAAVAIVDESGYSLGYADEGIKGYTPTTYSYDSYESASAAATMWNANAGLTPDEANQIVLSTMDFSKSR